MTDELMEPEPVAPEPEHDPAVIDPDDDTERCPRCGSERWSYIGDRQVCGDCGR